MMIDFAAELAVDDPLGEMATRADTRLLSGPEAFLFFHTVNRERYTEKIGRSFGRERKE